MFDMRNYNCYQSFSALKNIIYKQILSVNEGICLVGSKMHVYKLQKKVNYKEEEKIVFMGEINRNIIVITNKNIRIYDVRNGSLCQVLKGVFDSEENLNIFSAYCLDSKKRLFILNEEGDCVVYETNEMTQVTKFKFEPKPFSLYFDEENELFVQCSVGNIYISVYNE